MPNEEIRNIIIETAREIFGKYGFKKTTMDDIALAVRKGKSSIYYYFESKEDVFRAVVDNEISILRTELLGILSKPIDPKEKFKLYLLARMNKYGELVNFYNALNDDYLDQLGFIEKIRKGYDKEEIEMIKGILAEGVMKNQFEIANIEMTAVAIVTAMKGMEYPLAVQSGPKNLENTLDELLKLLFYGIMKK